MDAALWKLIGLHGRALRRRLLRGTKSTRGAIFLLLGVVMFVLWLGPAAYSAAKAQRSDPDYVHNLAPIVLLSACLTTLLSSGSDRAIAFTPAEVDFLFAAPFTRRQLLIYKLTKSAIGASIASGLLSIIFLRHASWWIACYVAVFLTLLFVQLFSMAILFIGQTFSEGLFTRTRKIIVGVAIGVIVAGVFQAMWGRSYDDMRHVLERFRVSIAGRTLLAPLSAFAYTLTARTFKELTFWGSISLCIDLAFVALAFRLDANYLEAAMQSGQRLHSRAKRVRRGGIAALGRSNGSKRRVPQLPWLGGAGPVLWRQLVSVMRGSWGLFILSVVLALTIGPILMMQNKQTNPEYMILGLMSWLTLFLSSSLKFDFRGDVEHLEELKALPVRPSAIAAAELGAPVIMMTVVHWIILIAAASLGKSPKLLLLIGIFALPVNGLLFAVQNLLFLLFSTRAQPSSPGDLQGFGRQIVLFISQLLVLAILIVIALIPAAFILRWRENSFIAAASVAFITLILECIGMIPLLSLAFQHFDVSTDIDE